MSKQAIALEKLQEGPHPTEHVNAIRDALPDDATFSDPDPDSGIFEVTFDAASYEDALQKVIDAIAAAGADDHVVIAEHT
jgi:hypothetical protein